MEGIKEWKDMFENPPAEYRTAPLWVWNGDMTDDEIGKSLEELKSHGFGGAFVHPRPGMRVSYLDENWFRTWGKALEKAKELGMKLNIYDENSYPSGFGGGHVSAELPDCLAESVEYQVVDAQDMDFVDEKDSWIGNKDLIAAYACERGEGKMILREEVTDLPRSKWKGKGSCFALVKQQPSQTEGWLAGFANVDLLRPEVTEKFLEIVYDGYAKHFQGDFGDTIQAIFTDEPSMSGSSVYGRDGAVNLPLNHWFGYEFQKRKGNSIMNCIPALFEDWEHLDNRKIRFDYYEVMQELWTENFLMPIQEWSRKHRLPFTGHFMEDGWPKPFYAVAAPGVMSSYEYQDWPGIDLLLTGRLKEQAWEVQQISMLEVMSAAHQFGKERVFCEAYGAGGYDSGLEDYKRIGDYLFVNGVNYINPHLTYTSYIGARKRDHPQSFDWRQSWWEEFTQLNDYLGRLSAVLSQGESRERVLVINPTMTGYLYPRNEDSSQLVYNEMAKEPDMWGYLPMIQELRRRQWDMNLGDEVIMKRHGKALEGKLEIVKQKYEVVILHQCMENLLPSTIALLKEYMGQGGKVLSVGKPGPYVAGEEKRELYEELFASPMFLEFSAEEQLLEYLDREYARYFTTKELLPIGAESIRRVYGDGRELYFFTNHSGQDICTEAEFKGYGIEKWEPWTGKTEPWIMGDGEGKLCMPLELKQGESLLICVYQDAAWVGLGQDGKGQESKQDGKPLPADKEPTTEVFEINKIYPEEKNVWPLEYCDFHIDGEVYKDCSVISAGYKLFRKRGFLANPWDNEVQFKTRTYERNRFYPEGSGFAAVYHFRVAKGFQPETVELAVEYGGRYEISVNGHPVSERVEEYFLDELIESYEIAPWVKEGDNEIRIEAKKFDVELELEPVTLRGFFGVYADGAEWVMKEAEPLKQGSWKGQGYPFYYGAMLYEGNIAYNGEESVEIWVPREEATAVSVRIEGENRGNMNLNGVHGKEIAKWLKQGDNPVAIRVCGSMKNYIGPHFDPEHPRRTAWPDMWRKAPKQGHPLPEDYDLIDYGLTGKVEIRRKG